MYGRTVRETEVERRGKKGKKRGKGGIFVRLSSSPCKQTKFKSSIWYYSLTTLNTKQNDVKNRTNNYGQCTSTIIRTKEQHKQHITKNNINGNMSISKDFTKVRIQLDRT